MTFPGAAASDGWRPAGSGRGVAKPASAQADAHRLTGRQEPRRAHRVQPSPAIQLVGWDVPAPTTPTAGEQPMMLLAPQNLQVAQHDDPFEEDSFDVGPTFDEPIETLPTDIPTDPLAETLPEEPPQRDPFEEDLQEAEVEALAQAAPAKERTESSPPAEASPAPLEEAQQAIEEELQRRELEDGLEEELPLSNPFRDGRSPEGDVEESDEERSALDDLLKQLEDVLPSDEDDQMQDAGPATGDVEERRRQFDQRRRELLEKQRIESLENCEEEFRKLRADGIDTVDLSIRVAGVPGADYPFECELGDQPYEGRQWSQTVYLWKASGLCHKPLYFEQVQLERYGHSWGPRLQPILSGAHFFMTLPVLPYKMGIRTPNECVYTLGYYRPGSCAPYMIDPVPFTWRAAFFEAGAWTAGALVIP